MNVAKRKSRKQQELKKTTQIKIPVMRDSCSVRALRLGRGSRSVVRRGDSLW